MSVDHDTCHIIENDGSRIVTLGQQTSLFILPFQLLFPVLNYGISHSFASLVES
jgi:hypothetical protein